jgi:hypothetical protein
LVIAAIAFGKHLGSFRTQKLSRNDSNSLIPQYAEIPI